MTPSWSPILVLINKKDVLIVVNQSYRNSVTLTPFPPKPG